MPQPAPKTLLFCTAFARRGGGGWQSWDRRFRPWLDAMLASRLHYDQILIVDDGSDHLPDWPDVTIVRDTDTVMPDAPVLLYHFTRNLGRRSVSDFPGWVRSFFFAAKFARAHGFEKVVHVESDAFLVSDRAVDYFNAAREGWTALWCPRWKRAESGLQIIAGAALEAYFALSQRDVEDYAGVVVEDDLPFTHIDRTLYGDRYGEYLKHVPYDADYAMQTPQPPADPALPDGAPLVAHPHYWWVPGHGGRAETLEACARPPVTAFVHPGPYFVQLLAAFDRVLQPRLVFESGSSGEFATRAFSCDTVCVDPRLKTVSEVRMAGRTLFFRTRPETFFAENNVAALLGGAVDIAFLDGEHLIESLLNDFINIERHCHDRSLILLHDCLPLNTRMAERAHRTDPEEDTATRYFWTGDVWKMLLVLRQYRPDIVLTALDCGPTGMIVCSGLDRHSTVLADRRAEILSACAEFDLATVGLENLWRLLPLHDTARLLASPAVLRRRFGLAGGQAGAPALVPDAAGTVHAAFRLSNYAADPDAPAPRIR